jgi:uncharacterized protein (TIGR01319 family)
MRSNSPSAARRRTDSPVDSAAQVILATDCGSTTTKAILIESLSSQGSESGYRLVARGEAPTTVEAPFDDVTVGVLNAVSELEELTGRRLLENGRVRTPSEHGVGADLYLSTSSAGGGLQMLVTGLVKTMTAESAQRAALGAGAIVVDVLALDDGRRPHEKIERIRRLRPDMILFSGGTDGGAVEHLLDMAEILRAADPRPRLGRSFRLPVIYAGNTAARGGVSQVLNHSVELIFADNIRPVLERENLGPSREAIHRLFLEHVMAQAPGYDKLLEWTSADIMPTPAAVGEMVKAAAEERGQAVLAVDIGGATTDVFSVFGVPSTHSTGSGHAGSLRLGSRHAGSPAGQSAVGTFNRTVSANLGLSYSVSNVLAETGEQNMLRWLPFAMAPSDLRNRLRNKMIRPTTVPQAPEELLMEQAVAREALRLAFAHHCQLAVGLKGIQQERTVAEVFQQQLTGETLVNMWKVGLIIGSGGVLSHAPRRHQAALMMIDAFQPLGVTELAADSIFMMPQLGVLAQVNRQASLEVLHRDCLIPLGTVAAPSGSIREGQTALEAELEAGPAWSGFSGRIEQGQIVTVPLPPQAKARLRVTPRSRGLDLGRGAGRAWEGEVAGGVVGLIFDCRGRPLELPQAESQRREKIGQWLTAIGAAPSGAW